MRPLRSCQFPESEPPTYRSNCHSGAGKRWLFEVLPEAGPDITVSLGLDDCIPTSQVVFQVSSLCASGTGRYASKSSNGSKHTEHRLAWQRIINAVLRAHFHLPIPVQNSVPKATFQESLEGHNTFQ